MLLFFSSFIFILIYFYSAFFTSVYGKRVLYEDSVELEELQKLTRDMRALEERGEFLEREIRRFLAEEEDFVILRKSGCSGVEEVSHKEDEYLIEWINLLFKKRTLINQEEYLRIREDEKKLDYLGNLVDTALRKYLDRSSKRPFPCFPFPCTLYHCSEF